MKMLPINNSDRLFILDDEDVDKVLLHSKSFHLNGYVQGVYCVSNLIKASDGYGKTIAVARIVLDLLDDYYYQIDHINKDPLDNRRCNLRKVTPSENLLNRKTKRGKSKYKNVYWQERNKKWTAIVCKNGQSIYGGSFVNEKDAAIKANELMTKLHGEFAVLNKIES